MSIFRIQKKGVLSSRSKVHSQQSADMYRFNPSQQKSIFGEKPSHFIKKRFATIVNQNLSLNNHFNQNKSPQLYTIDRKHTKQANIKRKQRFVQTGLKKKYNNSKQMQLNISFKNRQISPQKLIESIREGSYSKKDSLKTKYLTNFRSEQNSKQKLQTQQLNTKQKISMQKFNKQNKTNIIISNIKAVNDKKQTQKSIFQEAIALYNNKNTLRALKLFKQLYLIDQNNVRYVYYIGSCLLNQQNHQKSAQYFQLALKINDHFDQNIYLYQAINYKMLKMPSKAIQILSQGCTIFPTFQEGYFYLGMYKQSYLAKLQMSSAMFQKAEQNLNHCLMLNKHNQLALLFLADLKKKYDSKSSQQIYKELTTSQNFKIRKNAYCKLAFLLVQLQQWNSVNLNQCFEVMLQNESSKIQENLDILYLKCMTYYQRYAYNSKGNNFQQIKLWLQNVIQNQKKLQIVSKSIKLLLRIKIDQKDLYGAEQALNRCERLGMKLDSYRVWKLLIQGINDIIKRKLEQGQQKIQSCLQIVKNTLSTKDQNTKQKRTRTQEKNIINNDNKVAKQAKQQLTREENEYISKKASLYYSYLVSVNNKFTVATKIYHQLIGQYKINISTQRTQQQNNQQQFNLDQQQIIILHNKFVCQGIIHHENQNYKQAAISFKNAILQKERTQTIFLWAINQIIYLGELNNSNDKAKIDRQIQKQYSQDFQQDLNLFEDVCSALRKTQLMSPNYSLLYFYHSLISLYLKNYQDALYLIRMAISTIDELVSEYHFIEGLAYSLMYQIQSTLQNRQMALLSINKAIQIDQTIPQFFKQRSKHFYLLEKYELALADAEKVIRMSSDDQQAKLLCMFYSYVTSKYSRSEQLLKQTIYKDIHEQKQKNDQNYLEHKYKEFQQALMLRIQKYENTGPISKLLLYLTSSMESQLAVEYLQFVQDLVETRNQYSQFTVYFFNILLASYFSYNKQYSNAVNHLFGCLQQIQLFIDEKQKIKSQKEKSERSESYNQFTVEDKKDQLSYINTDLMLDEVKFNIVIVTLLKAIHTQSTLSQDKAKQLSQQQNQQGNGKLNKFQECLNFIHVFKAETQNTQLLQIFYIIQMIIRQDQQKQHQSSISKKHIQINPFFTYQTLSANFKPITFQIHQHIITTKMLVFYPQKLRFNIKPQFDESFLFNFDIGKVQTKFIPPWFKFTCQSNQQLFTQSIINQSVLLSQTQHRQSICLEPYESTQKARVKTKNKQSFYEKEEQKLPVTDWKKMMRLDSGVEKKLTKLMKK